MTLITIKEILSTPMALFLLMLFASALNGLKQLHTVRQTGTPMSFAKYWAYWPDTAGTIFANTIAFVLLIFLDQLNIFSALGIGYGANSAVDLLSGKRSYDVKATPDDPDKLQARGLTPPAT